MDSLPEDLVALVGDPASTKAIAAMGPDGAPSVAVRDTLAVLDGGTLAFAEELDTSPTSRALVHTIWFGGAVAVSVRRGDRAFHLRARPWRCALVGPLFTRFLLEARARLGGDADIAAVWVLKVDEVRDDSPATLRALDEARRPHAGRHLDRASVVRSDEVADPPAVAQVPVRRYLARSS